MKKTPYKYQQEGIDKMIDLKTCFQSDGMGLGKTCQSILCVDKAELYPCLIISPASLKINWEIEINDWTNKRGMILNDSIKNTFPLLYQAGISHFFIVNYESLAKYFVIDKPKRKDVKLSDITFNNYISFFKSIIVDESHKIKEPKAMQSKLTAGICRNKEYIYLLTGTPVLNNVLDLASQLCVLGRINEFGGYDGFMNKYKDCTNDDLVLLHKKLMNTCMIRREKKDVLDLPPKTRQIIYVDIDNRLEYDLAKNDLKSYLRQFKAKTDSEINRSMRMEAMVKIGILKQISGIGKIKAVQEYIESLIEQGEKVVLFGENIEVLNPFKKLPYAVCIVGGMSVENKQNSINMFQNNESTMLAVCSLKAAGVGVTLTSGRINIYIQQGWHSAIMEQAEDRQYRIGQTREVHCIYPIAVNTIDKYIYDVIEKKRETSNTIIGSAEDIEWGVIKDVIDLILNEDEKI